MIGYNIEIIGRQVDCSGMHHVDQVNLVRMRGVPDALQTLVTGVTVQHGKKRGFDGSSENVQSVINQPFKHQKSF